MEVFEGMYGTDRRVNSHFSPLEDSTRALMIKPGDHATWKSTRVHSMSEGVLSPRHDPELDGRIRSNDGPRMFKLSPPSRSP
jgi:hypothetical protein